MVGEPTCCHHLSEWLFHERAPIMKYLEATGNGLQNFDGILPRRTPAMPRIQPRRNRQDDDHESVA